MPAGQCQLTAKAGVGVISLKYLKDSNLYGLANWSLDERNIVMT